MSIFDKLFKPNTQKPVSTSTEKPKKGARPELVGKYICSTDDNELEESKKLVSFRLSTNNCMAHNDVYEGNFKDGILKLEHLLTTSEWVGDELTEKRHPIAAVEGEDELYSNLSDLFRQCHVDTWDGFRGPNPPGVLDGSSMSFRAVYSDGSTIEANGQNNFPKGYSELVSGLYNIICNGMVTSQDFIVQNCQITLPEEWVNEVVISYESNCICFSFSSDKNKSAFMRLDYSEYGYDTSESDHRLGRVVNGNEVFFISVYIYDNKEYDDINDTQKKILADLTDGSTYKLILESAKGLNGYTFLPETGKILYVSDVRNIFSKAQSFWLGLNLGGEYPSGCKTVELDGKLYKSVSASYEYPKYRDYQEIKNAMYDFFDEELANRVIDEKKSKNDLIIHGDEIYGNELYADYKKLDHPYLYGAYQILDEIDQPDDDHARIKISVMKANESDEKYRYSDTEIIEFELIRNASGKFVFKTFPYWNT